MKVEVPDTTDPKGRLAMGDQRRRMARQQSRLAKAERAGRFLELQGDQLRNHEGLAVNLSLPGHLVNWPGADILIDYLALAAMRLRKQILEEAVALATADYVEGQYEECRACQRVVPSPCHTLGGAMGDGPWDNSCMDILKGDDK